MQALCRQEGGGYSIRITIAKGMKLSSYLWNTADPDKWSVGDGVQGTQVPMDNATNDYFNGGSVLTDANGNTVLTYNTSDGCSSMNLTDKILVQPDELVTYGSDSINNAVKFELLDSTGTLISASDSVSVNVKIAKDKIRNSSYTEKKFTAGQQNAHLYQVDYYRNGLSSIGTGTVNITLGIPACVESITKLMDVSGGGVGTEIPSSMYSYDATNHILTITGYQTQEGKHFKCDLYGNISSAAAVKAYTADMNVTKFDYTVTYNGGTVTYTYPDDFSNHSQYRMRIVESQDVVMIDDYTSGLSAYSQPPEGYPSILGKLSSFYTSNAQTQDQIMTWEFDDNTLDIIGVFFPIDSATENKIIVTSVTFNDGTTKNLNLDFPKQGSQNLRYVNVADIKAEDSTIPDSAKYIKSITANCGKFSAGWASGSWYGKPVGYFNQTVVNAGQVQEIEYRFKVNSAEPQVLSVTYDPDAEISCLNITSTSYSDSDRQTESNNYKAGETIYMSTKVGVGGNLYVSTEEPRLYVVVPQWMSFNPESMKAKWWVTTSNSARPESDSDYISGLQYTYSYVKNAAGENYICYEFYIPNTAVGNYLERTGHVAWSGHHNTAIMFEYELGIEETASTQKFNMGDYIMAGKGDIKTGKFLTATGHISNCSYGDIWDLDGDGNRSEQDVIIAAKSHNITILDNMNITVSGYLTHQGGSDAVNPYDPGTDGSNEVNVVEFMPSDYADYHVTIANTLVSVGDRCSVNAYIPIPNGTFSGDTFIATNTDPTSTWYQFGDYKWPMELRSVIENTDPNTFDIVYYFDSVTLGQNGLPSATSTVTNPSSLTADQLDRVVLVEIKSKDGIKIPSGRFEFNLPLKVGVDETTATAAGMNLTKNIFRPRYHREGGIGAVWVNGNYVAARLAVSSIGGYVFEDSNGNGHIDEGEDGISDVTVELYDSDNVKLKTKTTDSDGKYSFTTDDFGGTQLSAGSYKIKVTNPNTSDYVFTKHVAPTQENYKINSEAVASSDNSYAELELTLPYSGVLAGYQEYQNAGLFVDKVGGGDDGNSPDGIPDGCEVRVDYDARNGSIRSGQKTFEYFYESDGNGGYKQSLNVNITDPPQVIPDSGCVLDHWENTKDTTTNNDGKFTFAGVTGGTTITVSAIHEPRDYTIHFDGNGETTDTITDIPDDQIKHHGEDYIITDIVPTREDQAGLIYTFTGWNTDPDGNGTAYPAGSTYDADADVTLYAQWGVDVNEYYVYHEFPSLDNRAFIEIESGSGQYGEEIYITAKDKPGFEFNYLITRQLDDHNIEFSPRDEPNNPELHITIPDRENAEIHIYYFYNRMSFTIEFDTGDGGSAIAPITALYEADVTAPADPVREGYIFMGWDKDIPDTMPAENMTITAIWQQVHTITFKNYDGTELGTSTGVEGSAINVPSVPERVGYNFTGWDQDLPDTMPPEDMTFTAQYSPIVYTISYTLNGGQVSGMNPTSYTIESSEIVLTNPTKPGYTFQGWTGTGLIEASSNVTIPAGSTGNRTYAANWPSTAEYTVEHYKQLVDGSYPDSADETETKYGSIGADTAAVAKTYDNLTAQDFDQKAIVDTSGGADPTLIKIYYNRSTHTITWKNEDGTVLETDNGVLYGATPSYDGSAPTKDADAQYTYSFKDWDPAITAVTGDASYTATYTPTLRSYTVKWMCEGTQLDSKTAYYGADIPAYSGTTEPSKTATDEHTYTFKEWQTDADVSDGKVNGDITYNAAFDSTVNKYTVKWVDEDGVTELDSKTLDYGSDMPEYSGATPTKAATAEWTYHFDKWVPDAEPVGDTVTRNVTFTASYGQEKNKYKIKFLDDDGSELQSGAVEYGETPVYSGATPEKKGDAANTYVFGGWEPGISAVSGDASYKATYTAKANEYTVKWVDEDGATVLDSKTLKYGSDMPEYSKEEPAKAATAEWTYAFDKWVPDAEPVGDTVTRNVTFTASYGKEKNKYKIIFEDEDGTKLQEVDVEYGAVPVFTGDTPVKEADEENTYTFSGWEPAVTAVTGEAVYKAKYDSEKIPAPEVYYYFTQGIDSTWQQEDGNGAGFRVNRNVEDATAFAHFTGIKVDGADVEAGNYDAKSGSVILSLKSDYIDSLEVGEHTLKAEFDDGEAETTFKVVRDEQGEDPADDPAEDPADDPKDDPAEDPKDDPADDPAEDPKDDPAEDPKDNPADDPAEDSKDDPAEDPKDVPADDPAEDPAEDPKDNPAEDPAEDPKDNPTDNPTDNPADDPKDDPAEDPKDVPADDPADDPKDDPAENPKDEPADNPAEDPADDPGNNPSENPAEDSGNNSSNNPADNPGNDSSDNSTDNEAVSSDGNGENITVDSGIVSNAADTGDNGKMTVFIIAAIVSSAVIVAAVMYRKKRS